MEHFARAVPPVYAYADCADDHTGEKVLIYLYAFFGQNGNAIAWLDTARLKGAGEGEGPAIYLRPRNGAFALIKGNLIRVMRCAAA